MVDGGSHCPRSLVAPQSLRQNRFQGTLCTLPSYLTQGPSVFPVCLPEDSNEDILQMSFCSSEAMEDEAVCKGDSELRQVTICTCVP
jgi:hypothetical protein